jgi:SAM-dependent MidA family methyltransferase
MQTPPSLPSSPQPSAATALGQALARQIHAAGGWIGFDAFMATALYAPGLGYYARDAHILGRGLPGADAAAPRGDFVTAPELGPWFGRVVAVQVAQALEATGTCEVWEFGAGSGALAAQLLQALGDRVRRYHVVELSAGLRARQQHTLQAFGDRVVWEDALPPAFEGVVVGNEVLDAMPVTLLHRRDCQWHERGVVQQADGAFAWADRPTALRPSLEPDGDGDYLTEIHPQAEAFVRTVAERLQRGAAFFFDYGFPEREYYHPQRAMGTLACHRAHRVDHDPLADVGAKDITAHVNFTGIAMAAQGVGDLRRARGDADIGVLGYTSQARFLLNCGIAEMLQQATWQERALANTLFMEHEMGELFKVIGLYCGAPFDALGFAQGDRCHTL